MSAAANQERELKFPVEGLEGLRERLVEIEAERVGPASFEDNWVLDRDGELEARGCVLRLRNDGRGARLTLKGPRQMDGYAKVRSEYEIAVGDLETARALFEALGYHMVRRYQKVREEWKVGGVEIALDHTPIGDYAEFEGDRAEVLAKRCGLNLKEVEQRSYLRLYEDYLKSHPDAPPGAAGFGENGDAADAGDIENRLHQFGAGGDGFFRTRIDVIDREIGHPGFRHAVELRRGERKDAAGRLAAGFHDPIGTILHRHRFVCPAEGVGVEFLRLFGVARHQLIPVECAVRPSVCHGLLLSL